MDQLPEHNRRFTDVQVERLSKVESEVTHIKTSIDSVSDKLQGHIDQNNKGFEELRASMHRLATTAEVQSTISMQQADSMKQLATTVSDIAKNDFKISTLEDFRIRTDGHLKACDLKHETTKDELRKTTERINRIYWLGGLLIAAIEVLSHLQEIAGHYLK